MGKPDWSFLKTFATLYGETRHLGVFRLRGFDGKFLRTIRRAPVPALEERFERDPHFRDQVLQLSSSLKRKIRSKSKK